MSIMPRQMFRELESLRDRIDRMFADVGMPAEIRPDGALIPEVDLQETDKEITVKASMPGVKPDDIDVKVDHNVLTLRGTSREERDETKGTWHVHERRFGSMYRSLTLPAAVKEDQAEARMQDGVLEIRLPKSDVSQGKQIKVKSS
jgi:HSP20 family protein